MDPSLEVWNDMQPFRGSSCSKISAPFPSNGGHGIAKSDALAIDLSPVHSHGLRWFSLQPAAEPLPCRRHISPATHVTQRHIKHR